MSKCREEFISKTGYTPEEYELAWYHWQAAWNARGKVDAEICKTIAHSDAAQQIGVISAFDCAKAIEQENEHD